jgi:hypothetical protein
VLASLLALTIWTDIGLNIDHPDTPIEPFMYAQTTDELRDLSDEVLRALRDGEASGVLIDNQANLTWPWAWYLRHEEVLYQDRDAIRLDDLDGRVVIGEPGLLSSPGPVGWTRTVYTHYEWPHEAGYRATTWEYLATGILDGSLPRAWAQFLLERDPRSPLQIRDGQVLFPPSAEGVPGSAGDSDGAAPALEPASDGESDGVG